MARSKTVKSTDCHTYKCVKCGQEYDKQQGYFYKNPSDRYAGNNNYIDVCNMCIDLEFDDIKNCLNGDELAALKYICHSYDWYYNEDMAKHIQTRKMINQPLLSAYLQNRGRYKKLLHKTSYRFTLEEEIANGDHNSIYEVEDFDEPEEIKITKKMKERWGSKTPPEDIIVLDSHYQMLHHYNPECTGNQEIYIKDLCYAHLMKMNALKTSNFDAVSKAMSTYQATFKNSGLQMVEESDGSENETYGVTLSLISQYTPEEYYKDKNLFKDYTGIGEYCKRFIERPIVNLVTGNNERDPEFHVYGDMPGEEES